MADGGLASMVREAYERGKGFRKMGIPAAGQKKAELWVRAAIVVFGLGLGFVSVQFEASWVTRSPLFMVAGCVGCLVFLSVYCMAGTLWWLVTSSRGVCAWAVNLMPFAYQPWRSAAGVAVVFALMAVVFCGLVHTIVDVMGQGHRRVTILVAVAIVLWLAAAASWMLFVSRATGRIGGF
jgi:hypothetical protein